MLVKATTSFAGTSFNMAKGQVKECSDPAILQDLLSCGYVEEAKPEAPIAEVKPQKPPKGGKANESKSNSNK